MADNRTLLKIQDVTAAVGGISPNMQAQIMRGFFTSVVIDSRKAVQGSLFIPLIGTKQDGHAYIPQAIEKGATVIFIAKKEYDKQKSKYEQLKQKTIFIIVENTLTALQKAAAAYVRQFPDLLKIGITGSAGKTTVKELINSVLSQKYNTIMNEGNLNSETGLPLSVFNIRSEHEAGIFEMGMNRKGEIAELTAVLFPDLAVITNIGTAHIGILGTKDAIAYEKKSIFTFFSKKNAAFIPENDLYADFLKKGVEGTIVEYGTHSQNITQIEECGLDGTRFVYKGENMFIPLIGKHNFFNALAAIAVGEYAGLTPQQIQNGFNTVKPLFGRSQIIKSNITLIQDCYNASPESVESIIDFCSNITWNKNKILVLGDMRELGEKSEETHRLIGKRVAQSNIDFVIFFGKEMKNAAEEFEKSCNKADYMYTDNFEELKNMLQKSVKTGDLVILKAANGMELWRVIPVLMHEGVAV